MYADGQKAAMSESFALTLTAHPWENLVVLLFVALVCGDRHARRRHPLLLYAAALAWLAGLLPLADEMARRSLLLHSLQSTLLHHLAPLLLLLAGARLPRRLHAVLQRHLDGAGGAAVLVLAFAAMGLAWMLPALHLPLMTSPALYSAMKWGMALSGLLLCQVLAGRWLAIGARGGMACHAALAGLLALPQLLIGGLVMFANEPLYPMPDCGPLPFIVPQAAARWLQGLDPWRDQWWAGLLLVLSALSFLVGDVLGRYRPFFRCRMQACRGFSLSKG